LDYLQKNSRSHRLTQTEDAIRLLPLLQPIHPLVNISSFSNAVRRKLASAFPMGAQVGEQGSVAAAKEKGGIREHASPVVGYAMQQEHDISGSRAGSEKPSSEWNAIGCQYLNILELCVQVSGQLRCCLMCRSSEWPSWRAERPFTEIGPGEHRKKRKSQQDKRGETERSLKSHGRATDCTTSRY
jgi:hypothetical protein